MDQDVAGLLAPQRVAVGIMGPCMLGWTLQVFLAGICLSTFYHYCEQGHLSRDTTYIKMLCIAVVVLNTTHGIFCAESLFHWGTTQNRSTAELWSQTTIDSMQSTVNGAVGFLVQCWFARRSTLLFQKKIAKWIFILIISVAIACAFGGAVAFTYYNIIYGGPNSSEVLARPYKIVSSVWLWASCVVDLSNTTVLYYLLRTHVVGYNERSDSLARRISRLAIETASYTALVALIAAVLSAATNSLSFYTADVNFVFFVPLPSLYTLSLLTTLASRYRLAEEVGEGEGEKGVTRREGNMTPSRFGRSYRHGDDISSRIPAPFMLSNLGSVTVAVDVEVSEDHELDEEKGWRTSRGKSRRGSILW